MAVTVITMGVHYRWELPEVVRVQLELAHQLREDLVTAQLETDAAIGAVWSKFPQVAEIEERSSNEMPSPSPTRPTATVHRIGRRGRHDIADKRAIPTSPPISAEHAPSLIRAVKTGAEAFRQLADSTQKGSNQFLHRQVSNEHCHETVYLRLGVSIHTIPNRNSTASGARLAFDDLYVALVERSSDSRCHQVTAARSDAVHSATKL
ncbi:hypothetical protein ACPXCG_21455 [Gordonia sp. DT218]|uniref:hypothetical protein n=1 Tax=Gordonia sp. DT218 TaxID=3416659 RepID=UPI003CF73F73